MDSEAILQHLFTRIPCELFHSPMLAFEFVCFCRDSLPVFGRNLDILRRSFPNLFKACSGVLRPEWVARQGGDAAPLSLLLPPGRWPGLQAEGPGTTREWGWGVVGCFCASHPGELPAGPNCSLF